MPSLSSSTIALEEMRARSRLERVGLFLMGRERLFVGRFFVGRDRLSRLGPELGSRSSLRLADFRACTCGHRRGMQMFTGYLMMLNQLCKAHTACRRSRHVSASSATGIGS